MRNFDLFILTQEILIYMDVENEGNMKLPSFSNVSTNKLILYLYGKILTYTECIATVHILNNNVKTPHKVVFHFIRYFNAID